jgi:hypothetical protein
MTGEPDNIDRADWARTAANVFSKEVFGGQSFDNMVTDGPDGDGPDVIGDLIGDLMHLAHQQGWDAKAIAERGIGHFEYELAEAAFDEDEDEPPMFQVQLGDPT